MRPVSAGWESTLAGSHTMVVQAIVCDTFQTGTSPTGTSIPILDGKVDLDGLADVRSKLDLTTDGSQMWPRFAADLFAPYGNEIYVSRGVRYSDILEEIVGLGYFRIDGPEQPDAPDGPIRLTAVDRMQGIIDGRLLAPVQFLVGTTLGDIVTQLVTEIYPLATIEWDDDTDLNTLTRSIVVDDDRYAFLDDLITGVGKIWYWDYRGVLVIKDLPSSTDYVYSIEAGRGGVALNVSRTLTRVGVYNAVVSSGEAPDSTAPVRGVAIDNSPNSPTYFYGRFGQVPRFFNSPLLGSNLQAAAASSTILRKQLGLPYSLKLGTVVNAALEPFDAVRVRPGANEGAETHVLQTLSVPLVEGVQQEAATKEQTVVLIGTS